MDLLAGLHGGVGRGAVGDAEDVEVVDLGQGSPPEHCTSLQLGRSAGETTA